MWQRFFFIIPYGKIFLFLNEWVTSNSVSTFKSFVTICFGVLHVYPKKKKNVHKHFSVLTGAQGIHLVSSSSLWSEFYPDSFHCKFSRDKVLQLPSDSKLVAFSSRVLDNIGQQDKSWNARFHLYWLSAINAASEGLGFCRHKGYFSKRGFSYSKTGEILT